MVIITIGGMPGSGKSTLGRMLAQKLDIPFFSMGDVRRQYARAHGMSIEELNAQGEADPKSDLLVDEFQQQLSVSHPSFVIDSRLGFHFLPSSIKIFLTVDFHDAAQRIMSQHRESEHWGSAEEGVRALERRVRSDALRYKKYYNIDYGTPKPGQYDFVLDTTGKQPEQTLAEVIAFLKSKGVE